MNNNENKNTVSYKIGQMVGTVVVSALALCAIAVVVALTAKFIFWLI